MSPHRRVPGARYRGFQLKNFYLYDYTQENPRRSAQFLVLNRSENPCLAFYQPTNLAEREKPSATPARTSPFDMPLPSGDNSLWYHTPEES